MVRTDEDQKSWDVPQEACITKATAADSRIQRCDSGISASHLEVSVDKILPADCSLIFPTRPSTPREFSRCSADRALPPSTFNTCCEVCWIHSATAYPCIGPRARPSESASPACPESVLPLRFYLHNPLRGRLCALQVIVNEYWGPLLWPARLPVGRPPSCVERSGASALLHLT